jgi:hypothetical protein
MACAACNLCIAFPPAFTRILISLSNTADTSQIEGYTVIETPSE